MQLKKHENVALWIAAISTVIPGLIVAGFFPEFNVLPTWAWMTITFVGAFVAGGFAAEKKLLGAVFGGITGLGLLFGIVGYVALRQAVFPTEKMFRIEIGIGALVGVLPGLAAYWKFARGNGSDSV